MQTPPTDLDVWVLAGQSNMEGCGPLVGALEPDPAVWSLASRGEWEVAQEPLHRLWESYTPVHTNYMRPGLSAEDALLSDQEIAERSAHTRNRGAGLGLSFGRGMHAATGRPVGLVPAAHGGTSLEQWNQDKRDEGGDSLYGAMLDRIGRAGGNLRGVLWYQGESDCSPQAAPTYAERFTNWIEALRRDTGRPDLPVLAVQLGRLVVMEEKPDALNDWDIVRDALGSLPERVPHYAVAGAIDLDLCDGIHIGTPGLIRLGRRLARHAVALQQGASAGPKLRKVSVSSSPLDTPCLRLEFTGVSGGWVPRNNLAGFTVHSRDGALHPTIRIYDVSPALDDPTALSVLVTGPLGDDVAVAYGLGFNPVCNAVDELDMPLLSFLPQAPA